MLALEGKKHVVKILDFGLAKATSEKRVDGALTKSGQMLGTPDYIAPEQTLDAPGADIRADLYSLGCTLYFLLAGKPPFTGNSLYEILHAHHAVTATPLDQLRPEVPAALAQVVARMMAKQPADRYQTPLDAAKALGPFFKAGAAPQPLPAEQPAVVPQAAPTAMPLMPFAPRLETAPSPFATSEGAAPAPLLNSATVTTSSSSAFPSYAPPSHIVPSYAPSPYTPSPYTPSPHAPPSYVPPSYDAPTASPVRTKTERKPPRKRGPGLLIAAAAGGCLLCLGIWLVVRDKEGNETARVQVPDGGSVQLQPATPTPSAANAEPTTLATPVVAPPNPTIVTIEKPAAGPLTLALAVSSPSSVAATPSSAVPIDGAASGPKLVATASSSAPAVSLPKSDDVTMPADAVAFGGKYYRAFTDRLTWKEAESSCRRRGGKLARVDSEAHNTFLYGMAKSAGLGAAWIDATDQEQEGVWKRNDGTPIRYAAWDTENAGQPNNAKSVEHYAAMAVAAAGKWWDYPDDPAAHRDLTGRHGAPGFICEWSFLGTPSTSPAAGAPAAPVTGTNSRASFARLIPQIRAGYFPLLNGRDLGGWNSLGKVGIDRQDGALTITGPDAWIATQRTDYRDAIVILQASAGAGTEAFVGDRMVFDKNRWSGITSAILDKSGVIQSGMVWMNFGLDEHGMFRVASLYDEPFELRLNLTGLVQWNGVDGKTTAGVDFRRRSEHPQGAIGIFVKKGSLKVYNMIVLEKDSTAAPPGPRTGRGNEQFVPLFNGRDLTGWRRPPNADDNWAVEDGAITCRGGPFNKLCTERDDFKNFHLRVEAKVNAQGNGGIHFRTPLSLEPSRYEAAISLRTGDPNQTGSMFVTPKGAPVVRLTQSRPLISADRWFTYEVIAVDHRVVLVIDGVAVNSYVDPDRTATAGHLALEHFDRTSRVSYRKVEIMELADGAQ
jgi:hypothetical protein